MDVPIPATVEAMRKLSLPELERLAVRLALEEARAQNDGVQGRSAGLLRDES